MMWISQQWRMDVASVGCDAEELLSLCSENILRIIESAIVDVCLSHMMGVWVPILFHIMSD